MNYFLSFIATFFVSVGLTGLLWRIGHKYKLLSKPRKRDVHSTPVPRIGGIGIFLSFLLISLLVFLAFKPSLSFGGKEFFGFDSHLLGIWLGGIFIVATMFVDDLIGLKVWQKMLAQVFTAVLVIGCGVGIDFISNPFGGQINLNSVYVPIFSYGGITYHFSLWSDLLTAVWLVGMMNIMNFVDGVDGLAGGQSVVASLTIFILSITLAVSQPATAMVAIILCGAVLGFLIWNFPPAKIFMGDSGSMFLGFILGILALVSGGKLATVFLVLGFPIVDGLIVTWTRIVKKKNPLTTPDKTHLHHRFLASGFSPRQAVLSLYVISAVFGLVALSSTSRGKLVGLILLFISIIAVMAILELIRQRKIKNKKS
jgi:UDP-GlcNAc:undecaprenyl-phosphate GlcNAc-1-phosphate transferase